MIWALALAAGAVVAAGTYLALSRHMLRTVVGVSLIGAAANLVLIAMGRPHGSAPAVIPVGQEVLEAATNPLPQALALTAIVIGFSLTCFSLILVLALKQKNETADGDAIRAAEPEPGPDGKPAIEEEG